MRVEVRPALARLNSLALEMLVKSPAHLALSQPWAPFQRQIQYISHYKDMDIIIYHITSMYPTVYTYTYALVTCI